MISFQNVSARYQMANGDLHPVLQNLSFHVQQRQFVAIMGRNGSGKTTLARLCNGLILPTAGEIEVDGMRISAADRAHIPAIRRLVGMVFQNPDNQLVSTTVEREIAFGLENLGVPHSEMLQRIDTALRTFDLERARKRSPAYLSGGEKQRLALAAVMAMQPRHLILDEPTAMLDFPFKRNLMHTISQLHRQSSKNSPTVLLITQDPVEALYADRLLILHDGNILFDAPPRDIFLQTEKLRRLDFLPPIEFEAFQILSARPEFDIDLEALILNPIL